MIMRIILNWNRIVTGRAAILPSSTNHFGKCELILIRYIMSIHPRFESISLPWPPFFSLFPRQGGDWKPQRGRAPPSDNLNFPKWPPGVDITYPIFPIYNPITYFQKFLFSPLTMLVPYSIIMATPISNRRE